MTIKVYGFASKLMENAGELGRAKLSGDPAQIEAAQQKLDDYEELLMSTDAELILDIPTRWANPR